MRVEIVNIDSITSTDRHREDMGDLHELARSIKEKGLIQPLAVQDPEGAGIEGYTLLAGGRRLEACKIAGLRDIPVRVYDETLSELERKSIELEENIRRKDLEFQEEVNLQREIHNLQVAIHGPKIGPTRTDLEDAILPEGHSMRDTAKLMGRDITTVSRDIKLANAMEEFPDLDWDKCKNKAEAQKLLARTEEMMIRKVLAERATSVLSKKKSKLADRYVVGDFFELVKNVPDGSMDLAEVDPPFAVGLPDIKKSFSENIDSKYNEIAGPDYPDFLERVVTECWRVMNDHSWLIFWFGPEPWFEVVFNAIIKQGFQCRRMPGIWLKTNVSGQTFQPDMYLGNKYEMFFYAYKGDATININKRGRSNVFEFPVIPPQKKIHPTEKSVPLMEEILNVFAYEGCRVLVPFAGGGNTIRAADHLKMDAIGYDLTSEAKDGYVARLVEEGLL